MIQEECLWDGEENEEIFVMRQLPLISVTSSIQTSVPTASLAQDIVIMSGTL
jgi:hypothetical protein